MQDLSNQVFHHLTVVQPTDKRGLTPHYLCKCECSREIVLSATHLLSGRATSCGCDRIAITEHVRLQMIIGS